MESKLVIQGSEEWTFDKIQKTYDILEQINKECFQLDIFSNQLEIISAEQMIDAYSSGAMPVMYPHWSFGGEFLRNWNSYKRGYSGLAYEVVINTNPSIAYLMEENTMLTQALVMAHACWGHNTFFKNNYLFKQWTDPSSIIDYLLFAKKYISECEEKYGARRVEFVLDAAHSLQIYGVDRYKRPEKKTKMEKEEERKTREAHRQSTVNELWSTIPKGPTKRKSATLAGADGTNGWHLLRLPEEPEENILYFIEKNAPKLQSWEREIIRIVRKVAQYFYPQYNTQLINEGCATFWHYEFINEMERRGHISEGAMIEFLALHTAVANQREGQPGFNVYALGFAMFRDIKRVSLEPTKEDRDWFGNQEWVGRGDWVAVIKDACANYKSDSFVQQFLSPKVMRDFAMFSLNDNEVNDYYEVTAIQDERGYRKVREDLAKKFNISSFIPSIEVDYVDVWDSRTLFLKHNVMDGRLLHEETAIEVMEYCAALWGYGIVLNSVDDNDKVVHSIPPDEEEQIDDPHTGGLIIAPWGGIRP
jgi:stage V sporulation protein R